MGRLLGGGLLLACLAPLAGCGGDTRPRPPAPADWRRQLSERDRMRLRDWRLAWMTALARARAAGAAAKIDGEGGLLAPDAALDMASPPDGAYRCRTIKLGAQGPTGLDYVAYPWFRCRIAGSMLVKLDGSQRPSGHFYPDDGRLAFIGAMTLGDEPGTVAYGRDPDRDMVGLIERIGPRRWRLVLPYPRWESLLDVIELVPAS